MLEFIVEHGGGSHKVCFYCDVDQNFHSECEVTFDKEIPRLTLEVERSI